MYVSPGREGRRVIRKSETGPAVVDDGVLPKAVEADPSTLGGEDRLVLITIQEQKVNFSPSVDFFNQG